MFSLWFPFLFPLITNPRICVLVCLPLGLDNLLPIFSLVKLDAESLVFSRFSLYEGLMERGQPHPAHKYRFESELYHLVGQCLWENQSTSLVINLPIYKMELILTSQGFLRIRQNR